MRELLLLLCRYPFDEANRETLSKLIEEVQDWNKLTELINAHGIIALAAYNIKEARLMDKIPGDAMAILENGYMKSIARNAWLTERWKEVNTILCNAGIKHILLKGMALEHTIYDSRGLRQMNDTDILIKLEDSVTAWNLLQQEGYATEPLKSSLFEKIRFEIGQHLPALSKNGYVIEIHNELFDRRITNVTGYINPFSDALEITIGEMNAHILSAETQLKYLISHFELHKESGDCQLRLYNDIVLLDGSNPPDFPDIFLLDPMQGHKKEFRKAAYKTRIRSIPGKYRIRFILGDTFPALRWMKERYKCSFLKALLWYPVRIVKIGWMF